jgi:DNA-binding Xre family transcriptional regulator
MTEPEPIDLPAALVDALCQTPLLVVEAFLADLERNANAHVTERQLWAWWHSYAAEDPETQLAAWLAAIGKRLRTARQQRGTSQQSLAARTGLSEKLLAEVEANTSHHIDVAQLARVAAVLWVSVPDLITTTGKSPLDRGAARQRKEGGQQDGRA